MNHNKNQITYFVTALSLLLWVVLGPLFSGPTNELKSLLPKFDSWDMKETSQTYHPENLFEYINGAAESYHSYEFIELVVAEYIHKDQEGEVIVEIYDMGKPDHAFGIYSSERYPDSNFITIGTQGYLEQGTLNFLVGRYYVKLMCFECGDESGHYLRAFAESISQKVSGDHAFPEQVKVFPDQGLIPYSEKFVLVNYLGYDFLHSGYAADYQWEGNEFSCFLIAGDDEQDSKQMLDLFLEAKKEQEIKKTSYGYHIKDRYYDNILIARKGATLCGVMEVKDSFMDKGILYLENMIKNSTLLF
ncbi:MAG: hypothetical protein GF421_13475 [Candidatus Aminicenantes bacterium]|nr:hypothetical protein [Candidatus Aminicenantes bacterium]